MTSTSGKPTARQNPSTAKMVASAIAALAEGKKGSTSQAIKKYLREHFSVDIDKQSRYIRNALISGVERGTLVRTKGKGAAGSFRLDTTKALAATKAKAKADKEKAKKKAIKLKQAEKKKEAARVKKEKAKAKKPKAKTSKSPKKTARKTPAKVSSAKKVASKPTKKTAKTTAPKPTKKTAKSTKSTKAKKTDRKSSQAKSRKTTAKK